LKITADTNVLVRVVMNDHVSESSRAIQALRSAEQIVLTLPTLCELVWVLTRVYRKQKDEIAHAIRTITDAATVLVDRAAVEAGLAILEAGGEFADGVIAFEGRKVGGNVFTTFDKQAAKLIAADGGAVALLSSG
jgi:predicted nucleic-acid-binding protein